MHPRNINLSYEQNQSDASMSDHIKRDLRLLANMPEIRETYILQNLSEKLETIELRLLCSRFVEFFKHSEQLKTEKTEGMIRRQNILEEENLFHLDGLKMKNLQLENYKKENRVLEEKLKSVEMGSNQLRNSFEDQLRLMQEKFENNKNNNNSNRNNNDDKKSVDGSKNSGLEIEVSSQLDILAKTLAKKERELGEQTHLFSEINNQLQNELVIKEKHLKLIEELTNENNKSGNLLSDLKKKKSQQNALRIKAEMGLANLKTVLEKIKRELGGFEFEVKTRVFKEVVSICREFHCKKLNLVKNEVKKEFGKKMEQKFQMINKNWEQKIVEKVNELQNIKANLEQKEQELKMIKNSLNESKEGVKELIHKVEQRENELGIKNEENNNLKKCLNEKENEVKKLGSELTKKHENSVELNDKIKGLENTGKVESEKLHQSQKNLQIAQKEKLQLETLTENVKNQLLEMEKKWKSESNNLKSKDIELKKINDQLALKVNEFNKLKGETKQKTTEIANLYENLNANKLEVENLLKKIKTEEKETENLKKELVHLETDLKNSIKNIQTKENDFQKINQTLKETKSELEKSKLEIEKIKNEIEKNRIETENENRKSYEEQIMANNKIHDELSDELKKLHEQKVSDLIRTNRILLTELDAKNQSKGNMPLIKIHQLQWEKNGETLNLSNQNLEAKNDELLENKKELFYLKKSAKKQTGEIAKKEKEIKTLQNKLDKKLQKNEELGKLTRKLEKEIDEKNNNLASNKNNSTKQIEERKKECEVLQVNLNEKRKKEAVLLTEMNLIKEDLANATRNNLKKDEEAQLMTGLMHFKTNTVCKLEEAIFNKVEKISQLELKLEKQDIIMGELMHNFKQTEGRFIEKERSWEVIIEEMKEKDSNGTDPVEEMTNFKMGMEDCWKTIEIQESQLKTALELLDQKECDIVELTAEVEALRCEANDNKVPVENQAGDKLKEQENLREEIKEVYLEETNKLTMKIDNLKKDLTESEKIRNKLLKKLKSEIQNLILIQTELTNTKKENKELIVKLKSETRDLNLIDTEFTNLKKQAEIQNKKFAVFKDEKISTEKELQKLENVNKNLLREKDELKLICDNRISQKNDYKQRLNKIEKVNRQITDKLNLNEKHILKIQKQSERSDEVIEELNKELILKEKELKKLQEEITKIQEKNGKKLEEIQISKEKMEEKRKLKEEENTKIKTQLKTKENELVYLSNELERVQSELANVNKKLEKAKNQEKEIKRNKKKWNTYKNATEKEIKKLKKNITNMERNFEEEIEDNKLANEEICKKLNEEIIGLKNETLEIKLENNKLIKENKRKIQAEILEKSARSKMIKKTAKRDLEFKEALRESKKVKDLSEKLSSSIKLKEYFVSFIILLLEELERVMKWDGSKKLTWTSVSENLEKASEISKELKPVVTRVEKIWLALRKETLETATLDRTSNRVSKKLTKSGLKAGRANRKGNSEDSDEEDENAQNGMIVDLKKKNSILKLQNNNWRIFEKDYFRHYCCDGIKLCAKKRN